MPAFIRKLRSPAVICAVLLAGHGLLLAYAAVGNSATFDEPAHLAAGCEYWRRGDFSIYSLSPPLLRLWAAWPAVLAGAKAPATAQADAKSFLLRHWAYVDAFVSANFSRFPMLLVLARLGMIPLSCLAGWVTYRWARALYGPASGAAACAMYCLNPSILAHASLVTTDLGTAATILVAAWLWWRFCRAPSASGWVLACLAVAAAHLCKFTAVLLWPMLLAMSVPFTAARLPHSWRWKLPTAWVGLIAGTLLIVNALYGFHSTGAHFSSFKFDSTFMQSIQRHLPAGFPSPLPRLILLGMDAQKLDTQGGYPAFLFGEVYWGSRWYYYPAALCCKLPVSMLLLAAAALASLLVRRRGATPQERVLEWSLFLALVFFAIGVGVLGDVNIGTRYLLPAFPLAMILISRLWSLDRPGRLAATSAAKQGGPPLKKNMGKFTRRGAKPESSPRRAILPYLRDGLLALLAIEMLWVCPRFLTFINFAMGGPSNGWRLLSDSDFDWGQGLIDLRHWMTDHKVPRVSLVYFGYVDPVVYGVRFEPIIDPIHSTFDRPAFRLGSEKYVAVSAYYLDGMAQRIQVSPDEHVPFYMPFYQELQDRTPSGLAGVAGNTIFIYPRAQFEDALTEGLMRSQLAQ